MNYGFILFYKHECLLQSFKKLIIWTHNIAIILLQNRLIKKTHDNIIRKS